MLANEFLIRFQIGELFVAVELEVQPPEARVFGQALASPSVWWDPCGGFSGVIGSSDESQGGTGVLDVPRPAENSGGDNHSDPSKKLFKDIDNSPSGIDERIGNVLVFLECSKLGGLLSTKGAKAITPSPGGRYAFSIAAQ
ncbi:hypothetical protein HDU82_001152 [Entophlyctis luteolus]|nr:hypothetical protein HDU82_001152 [Entophlyctis luteolus]KAJ3393167.1 hypothetical protein HDU84_002514 [Entophlyctis sp. JEL0112]